jgi:transcriptional regulator with XRE-family HTH domain
MTCGIYLLKFKGTNQVYVGQAYNIEKRYVRHIYCIREGLASAKMLEAAIQFGEPTLETLCECSKEELYLAEKEAIELYDSINSGFNSVNPMEHTIIKGEMHGMSKYSNEEIIEMFLALVKEPNKTQKEIAEQLGISEKVVNLTACGITHKWLQNIYPKEYAELMIPRKSGPKPICDYKTIISPEGVEHTVDNIKQFALYHSIEETSLGRLLRGKIKSTRSGWKAK